MPPSGAADQAVSVIGSLPDKLPLGSPRDDARNFRDGHVLRGGGLREVLLPTRAALLCKSDCAQSESQSEETGSLGADCFRFHKRSFSLARSLGSGREPGVEQKCNLDDRQYIPRLVSRGASNRLFFQTPGLLQSTRPSSERQTVVKGASTLSHRAQSGEGRARHWPPAGLNFGAKLRGAKRCEPWPLSWWP